MQENSISKKQKTIKTKGGLHRPTNIKYKGVNIMNLIDELKAKSNQADNTKQEIIEEIKNYFDEYLNSERFEKFLKANIREDDIRARRKNLYVEFWEYHSGCTTTNFYCGGKQWFNPECKDGWNSHYYKNIELRTIHDKICQYLTMRLISRMSELGFTVLCKENKMGRMEYYKMSITFGW